MSENLETNFRAGQYLLIYMAAILARHVYPIKKQDRVERDIDLAEVGVKHFSRFSNARTDTQGATYFTDEIAFFVFRGTESIRSWGGVKDWCSNILGLKWSFYGIRAHHGFSRAARSVIAHVVELCGYLEGKKIVIVGHSLGGAIAFLIAVALVRLCRLEKKPLDGMTLITFGQPRVTSARAGALALLGLLYLRVENGSDVISKMPPPVLYGHSGENIYYPNNQIKLGPVIESPTALTKLKDRLFTFGQRISDHSMSDIIKRARISAAAHCPEAVNEMVVRRARAVQAHERATMKASGWSEQR